MHAAATRTLQASPEQLAGLAPLAALSPDRLRELADIAVVERAGRDSDVLRQHVAPGRSVFLIRGELLLVFAGGGTQVIVGGAEGGRHAINKHPLPLKRTKAITDVELLSIEDEVLDILVTWDQVAQGETAGGASMARAVRSDSRLISGIFSLSNLRHGVFSQMPAASIDELLKRFDRLPVHRGDTVIREGEEGDYYYVVESGRCQVERMVGGAKMVLAELKSGDAFGEEALVSEAKRNATVVVTADGELLRLRKQDFDQLLREPLLHRVNYEQGTEKVAQGAVWLDVRYPSEYQYDKLPGAINVPLNEVRDVFTVLDKSKDYVAYCQSGRRSSAAAFLLAQRGFKVWLLEGGLWAAGRRN